MRITVLSGKGGVGKSMITSALATLFARERKVIAIDCDVDAPNLAIWLGIDNSEGANAKLTQKISTQQKPVIDTDRCTRCGLCVDKCNFDALETDTDGKASLIDYRCEGCGLCEIVCPAGAIEMREVQNCTMSVFETAYGFPVVEGQIVPGEAESGEAVTEIREYASSVGGEATLYIQDSAAGIGCPVIASVVGSDYVIAVTEPSLSSFSDLKRAIEVVEHFDIPWGVVINKVGLNDTVQRRIDDYAGKKKLGEISYDTGIFEAVSQLIPILETNLGTKKELERVYTRVNEEIMK